MRLRYRQLPVELQNEIKQYLSCVERWGISAARFTDICRRNRSRIPSYYEEIRRHSLPKTIRYHKDNTFSLALRYCPNSTSRKHTLFPNGERVLTPLWGAGRSPEMTKPQDVFSYWHWSWVRQNPCFGGERAWSITLSREWWIDISSKKTGKAIQDFFLPSMKWMESPCQWPLRIEYRTSIYPECPQSLHYQLLELATWITERQAQLTDLYRKGQLDDILYFQ